MGKTVVIYAGGFQPFHTGHLSSYIQAKKAFPDADFYVAASGDVKNRPIPFEAKKFLATQAGVDPSDFPDIVVKSPLNPKEILSQYNPEEDVFVLVRSERDPMSYTKKDGTPGYFQPLSKNTKMQPFDKHGYVFVTKKHDFKIKGQEVYSGTQVRDMYQNADDKGRINIIKALYPQSDKHKAIKNILDKYIGASMVSERLKNIIKAMKPLLKEATPEQKEKLIKLLKEAKNKDTSVVEADNKKARYQAERRLETIEMNIKSAFDRIDKLEKIIMATIKGLDLEKGVTKLVRDPGTSSKVQSNNPELNLTESTDYIKEK